LATLRFLIGKVANLHFPGNPFYLGAVVEQLGGTNRAFIMMAFDFICPGLLFKSE
jgi:hypothetical protein